MNNNLIKNLAIWLLIGFLVFLIIDFYKANDSSQRSTVVSYSNFLTELNNGNITKVEIRGNNIKGEYSNGSFFTTYAPNDLNLIDQNTFAFCWIVDYPIFEIDEKTKKIKFSHNPFSMPQGGMESLKNKNPLDILAWQFDIVCNGVELSSGAIRNHKTDIMIKAFEIAGYDIEELKKQFGFLFNAFKYGAPPHGGSAPGIDRMIMLLSDEENLREVVAFPMNQQAQDLMLGSPTEISEKHLKELGISLKKEDK